MPVLVKLSGRSRADRLKPVNSVNGSNISGCAHNVVDSYDDYEDVNGHDLQLQGIAAATIRTGSRLRQQGARSSRPL